MPDDLWSSWAPTRFMHDNIATTPECLVSSDQQGWIILAFIPLRLSALPHGHLTLAVKVMVIYVILKMLETMTLLTDIFHLLTKAIPSEAKPPP